MIRIAIPKRRQVRYRDQIIRYLNVRARANGSFGGGHSVVTVENVPITIILNDLDRWAIPAGLPQTLGEELDQRGARIPGERFGTLK